MAPELCLEKSVLLKSIHRRCFRGKPQLSKLVTPAEMTLSGSLKDHELHFFRDGEKGYVALQGVNALAEPGLYPLTIQGDLQDGAILHLLSNGAGICS